MSEILNLAEKFKQKSDKTAESIENELDSVMSQLNSFMIAKLKESETIIKNGMADLSVTNKQLKQMLEQHTEDMNTALTNYLNNVQARLTQDLKGLISQIKEMIDAYTAHIERLLESREDRIAKIIKSDIGKWSAVFGVILLAVFVLGIFLGASVNGSPIYKYYHDNKSGQTYMLPMD